MLCEDKVDFVVGFMFDVFNDIVWVLIYYYDLMLIMLLDYLLVVKVIVMLEDFLLYGLILLLQWLFIYWLVDLVFQQCQVLYYVVIEVGGWDVIKEYVVMGLGILVVIGICIIEVDCLWLVVCNMKQYFLQCVYGVVMCKGKFFSIEVCVFIDLICLGLLIYWDYDELGYFEC